MIRSVGIAGLALAVLLSGFALATVRGEQAPPQTTSALLDEVRLLRRAIETLAGTGARVQIVFGRLQLQEQRTTAALRRLDEVRTALAVATNRVSDAAERVTQLEGSSTDSRLTPKQQEGMQFELVHMKREWTRLEAERARLAADESEAAAVLAQEQGRWSDLNRQLEELERALAPRQH